MSSKDSVRCLSSRYSIKMVLGGISESVNTPFPVHSLERVIRRQGSAVGSWSLKRRLCGRGSIFSRRGASGL